MKIGRRDAAERLYHVHGTAGADPSEPRRSSPFPYPAVSHEPRIQKLSDDFAKKYNHNPKFLIRWICNSQAYGLKTTANSEFD